MKSCGQLSADIPVMILCGGRGTRLRDVTEVLPKPMVPVGELPILWHIMKCYAAFGVRRFILCLGYKQESFIDFFMNFHMRIADATIRLGHDPEIQFHQEVVEADWRVTLAQTGIDSKTATRVARAARYLKPDDQNFFLTYGDGVADIDMAALLRSHLDSDKLLTVSAVHPPARFGEMTLDADDHVVRFSEKPLYSDSYINGGFMVLKREFLDRYVSLERDEFFEYEPIRSCVAEHQMHAYRHEGFWQCMDTPREYALLNDLWSTGKAPWTRYWKEGT